MKNSIIMSVIGHVAINVIRIFSILVAFCIMELPWLTLAYIAGADNDMRSAILAALFLPMCGMAYIIYNVIINLIIMYDKKNKRKGA